jgi:zinc/manganese transport system permease protein
MNLDGLDPAILVPALLAGLLVLSTHVPLGREVLSRGIIFIDLAIAQIAVLGVVAATTLGLEEGGVIVQLAAAASALVGAVLLNWSEKRWPQIQEALIGTTFVLAATGSLLVLHSNPHGAEHMTQLLSGQILWVSYRDLIPVAVLYVGILLFWFMPQRRSRAWFYLLFALGVTMSVQLVGVYLVFTSLIVPALSARSINGRRGLIVGYIVGATGYVLGLLVSAVFDLPSGPMIVWMLALVALVKSRISQTDLKSVNAN